MRILVIAKVITWLFLACNWQERQEHSSGLTYAEPGKFVSADVRFQRSAPPTPSQLLNNWQAKAWRGERVHTQALQQVQENRTL